MAGAADDDAAPHPEIDVEVIIPVHDVDRPLHRAVGSVLQDAPERTRVTVVAHGLDAHPIRAALAVHGSRVRVLSHVDGINSPAGPFNAGLAGARARFVSVMGSDDELEPGALTAWLALADRTGASAVIPRLRHADGRAVPTPATRPGRWRDLDPVRDRLAYRTAPLGLLRQSRFGALRMVTGLASGEDLAFALDVWFSGEPIVYARRAPGYVIHADAAERVTFTSRPMADDLAALAHWRSTQQLHGPALTAVVVKLLRIHVFGAISNRPDAATWTPADADALRREVTALLALAPDAVKVLSRTDRRLLETVLADADDLTALSDLAALRRRRLDPRNLLTRDLRHILAREAPVRFSAASVLVLLS